MPDATEVIPEPISPPISATASKPFDRQRWFEVFLVLAVAFVRPLINSIYLLSNGVSAQPRYTNFRWWSGVIEEVVALLLLGYVLSRRKVSLKNLGLRWSFRDVGVGLLLTFGAYGSYFVGSMFVYGFRVAMYGHPTRVPSGNEFFGHPSMAAIPYFILSPFFEEIIVRAYLMTEIVELTGSSVLAIVASVAVQGAYHLYYGWAGAIGTSFIFLAFALFYAWTRRALPVVMAHEFIDMVALIRIW